jgi:ABC-type polysaccharide/polyol phosphate export permease
LHSTWPNFGVVSLALVWTLLLTVTAYTLFKRLERDFADRV